MGDSVLVNLLEGILVYWMTDTILVNLLKRILYTCCKGCEISYGRMAYSQN